VQRWILHHWRRSSRILVCYRTCQRRVVTTSNLSRTSPSTAPTRSSTLMPSAPSPILPWKSSRNTCPVSRSTNFSSGVYFINVRLLLAQIPKAQKNTVKSSVFFALLGSVRLNAAHKTLVKLTPGVQRLTNNFYKLFFCHKVVFKLSHVYDCATENVKNGPLPSL